MLWAQLTRASMSAWSRSHLELSAEMGLLRPLHQSQAFDLRSHKEAALVRPPDNGLSIFVLRPLMVVIPLWLRRPQRQRQPQKNFTCRMRRIAISKDISTLPLVALG